jgi:hypothetical protein
MSVKRKSLNKKTLTQQGDVLCFGGEQIPEGVKPMKLVNGCIVLALGEATGHSHTVVAEPSQVEGVEKDGVFYLNVKGASVTVKHQEHKPIILKQGTYRIGIVREVDPFSQEIRKVQD